MDNLKDPRHEDFNYNTIALPFLVSLMKQPFLDNLNILSVQLKTSSTIERESHFKIMGWSQDDYAKTFFQTY